MNRLPPLPPPTPGPQQPDPATRRVLSGIDATLAGDLCGRILRLQTTGQITHAAARELLLGVHEMFRAVDDFACRVRTLDELRPSVN